MSKQKYNLVAILILILGGMNCKEVYQPKEIQNNPNLLVVDGIVISGSDSTIITLSRTRSISGGAPSLQEVGAQVSVLGISGVEYPFIEQGNGRYGAVNLQLDTVQQYQLKIITSDGNEFRSELGKVHTSPPIDSVYWNQDSSNNVRIYLNTQDPLNNTRYYRWEYRETWEYHSAYNSFLEYNTNTGTIDFRSLGDQIYRCYQSQASSAIEVASTKHLSADVVNKYNVTTVPVGSEKISFIYSDLVRQYAIPENAYNFWQNLKKNTEQLGTLFDLQPFTELGNIKCVSDPGVKCIGFISFTTLQEKRIFISKNEISSWHYNPYFGDCAIDTIPPPLDMNKYFPPGGPYFYSPIGTDNGAFLLGSNLCVDCTYHGGSAIKPPYWP
jgi:hypothetical protein